MLERGRMPRSEYAGTDKEGARSMGWVSGLWREKIIRCREQECKEYELCRAGFLQSSQNLETQ